MLFFIIFLPFLTLGVLSWIATVTVSLFGGAGVALALIVFERARGRSAKILNIATAVLLGGLGLAMVLLDGGLTPATIRVSISAGLLLVALTSIALRFPFTLQYAREEVAPEVMAMPTFLRTNYILTWAWVGAFVLMLVADIVSVWWPSAPLWIGVAATFASRNAAVQFTKWYTQRARARAAQMQA
ncbi:hypothetical protein JQ557_17645 [Bradyrhizobium sp. U87765 SZCCT0131]|uniref:hypothetical protein n=1 Tax=unclassified Bradyrhizobium TaxID=2631580 RepID=UPI001BAE1FE7|nr:MULTISPECIES: hypothetical protein [unclassified Bradyrhizobium]MBR1219836.1 hypothetical protein [Bradyrhizobium sp. U87765 SZCCT0131]MBR1262487.1 hypothetical protein [Bradyrhizobium sp. U87765 SZCCT0134]MBR1308330.1 hypothetical protein [Bradyrhizobium sp. U87765 SZCCT0110]MBR1318269.1 hypothetical protein [Bradyrhizobium sp. U87765 SZCCT0109]MBR1351972.1 hypothetical protein [Bradyrhizobium sp. U87765 SZCCT0048]